MARRGAGPIPSTVIVPGGTSVWPASLTSVVTKPAACACPASRCSVSRSSARRQIFLAPPFIHRSTSRACDLRAFNVHVTAACEHWTASLPADILRSLRAMSTIDGCSAVDTMAIHHRKLDFLERWLLFKKIAEPTSHPDNKGQIACHMEEVKRYAMKEVGHKFNKSDCTVKYGERDDDVKPYRRSKRSENCSA
jgi:hypothetical protein